MIILIQISWASINMIRVETNGHYSQNFRESDILHRSHFRLQTTYILVLQKNHQIPTLIFGNLTQSIIFGQLLNLAHWDFHRELVFQLGTKVMSESERIDTMISQWVFMNLILQRINFIMKQSIVCVQTILTSLFISLEKETEFYLKLVL